MITWTVGVDWEKNGTFTDLWEDVIHVEWRLGMGKPYQRVADESTCRILLRNDDGKYNPEASANPLLPHRLLEIRADGQLMWRGWVDQIQPKWESAGAQTGKTTAMLKGAGAKQLLQEAEVNLPLQQNKRADQIIGEVLKRVVLPPAVTGGWILGRVGFSELGVTTRLARESDYADLETGVLVFPYYGDARATGYQIIKDVTEAERGFFFFGRDGKAVWWNRNRLLDAVWDDAVVDTSGAGVRPYELDYRFGASVANRIQVSVYPRKPSEVITLWELNKPLQLGAGEVLQFEAPFSDEFDQPAGGLTLTPADVVFSTGTGTVEVSLQADRALVTLTNTGTTEAILTSLRLQGEALTSKNRVVIRQEDSISVRDYGRRGEIKLNLKALEDYAEAAEIADLELRRRKDPRGEVRAVSFLNRADGSANAAQLNWQIGDRIRVQAPELGHNFPYFIVGEQHEVSAGGKVHQTHFVLEPLVLVRLAYHPKSAYDRAISLKQQDMLRLAQAFSPPVTSGLGRVRLWLRKIGAPNGDLSVKICANTPQGGTWRLGVAGSSELGLTTRLAADSDYPQNTPLSNGVSELVKASSLTSGFGWVEFHWATPPQVDVGNTYWLVLETSDAVSGADFVQWGAQGESAGMLAERGASWKRLFCQAIFEIYQAV